MTSSRQIVVICLLLAAHVVLDLCLLQSGYQIRGGWDLVLLAWPFSQGSLIAIWAAISRARSYIRFPAALLGLCCTWFVLVHILRGQKAMGPESAGWALLLVTQAMVILIFITAGYLLRQQIHRRRSAGMAKDPRPMQFSLRFLLLWTTLLAAGLGLGRQAFAYLGWTSEVVQDEYFYYHPVLGTGNTVFALIVLASLAGRAWLVARILVATLLTAALGYAQWHVFMFLFGDAGSLTVTDLITLAAFQAIYLYATLLPLRRCGCLDSADAQGA